MLIKIRLPKKIPILLRQMQGEKSRTPSKLWKFLDPTVKKSIRHFMVSILLAPSVLSKTLLIPQLPEEQVSLESGLCI